MSPLSSNQLKAISLLCEGISPPQVATRLKVSYRTIQRWLKVPEFQQSLDEIRAKTQNKVIEKTSDVVSERININMRKLQKEHIDCYSRFRKIAEMALAHYEKKMLESPEDCNLKHLSLLIQVLDRSIRGEADSAFFKYLDIDEAIRAVTSCGYTIYDEVSEPLKKVSSLDLN
jgi:uncharacterized coiled-coil protein SlyX